MDSEEPYAELPPTNQLFLEDTALCRCEATVLAASAAEVVLDASCFHPQGGGQPSDLGTIEVDGKFFDVSMVKARYRARERW